MTPPLSTPEADLFTSASEQYQYLIDSLNSQDFQNLDHGDIEAFLDTEGRELLRRLFQGHLDSRAQEEGPSTEVIGSDEIPRPHRRKGSQRQLESVFGGVVVTRLGYSTKQVGISGLYPADGKLNLPPDQYSDGVRQRIALEASKVSFEETSRTLRQTTGAKVGKRQCEEIVVKVAQDFEDFYAQRPAQKSESSQDLLVLTSDGKGIVMHEEDLRSATAKAAIASKTKKKTRLAPGQKRQRKRMATIASVYSTPSYPRQPQDIFKDEKSPPTRPEIVNKRVWASVRRDAKAVLASVFEEASKRDPRQQRPWVFLVDGHRHQLDLIETMAKAGGFEVTIVLDFIHVLEYLWKAGLCFFESGSEQLEAWVKKRGLQILQGKSSDIAAGMRRSATLQKLSDSQRRSVDKCADYLLKYRPYLNYDRYLDQGYPIATGVIEGACRHLVCDRMDITGARWRLDRAEAVLQIRALRASGHFEEYWQFHKIQEFKRNHFNKFLDPERLLAA